MKQQYVLITGGTSGIGLELAKLFAADGYNLVLCARGKENLNKTAGELVLRYGIDVVKIPKDLFEPMGAFDLYYELLAKGIAIEILVNAAGQGQYGTFISTDIRRELSLIQLNVSSVVVLTKLFLQDMVKRGRGKILNVSSVASKIPGPLQSVYHATKAFVHSFTEAIREEVKDAGVTITSLLPGATATDFFNKAGMLNAKNIKEGKLDDPAMVALEGYEALVKGDDMVVTGFNNKLQIDLANFTSDKELAEKMHKEQAPVI